MENYTSAQRQLSRKMFGQCRLCRLKTTRSFGFTTIACLGQRTRPLWRVCARWLGNKQTRVEAYNLEGVINAYLCYWCRCLLTFSDSWSCFRTCRHANEARISWNAPLQHEADDFLKESLDDHFKGNKWHFYSTDQQNRPLVSCTSKVIDGLEKMVSKLSFMKNSEEVEHDALF